MNSSIIMVDEVIRDSMVRVFWWISLVSAMLQNAKYFFKYVDGEQPQKKT